MEYRNGGKAICLLSWHITDKPHIWRSYALMLLFMLLNFSDFRVMGNIYSHWQSEGLWAYEYKNEALN